MTMRTEALTPIQSQALRLMAAKDLNVVFVNNQWVWKEDVRRCEHKAKDVVRYLTTWPWKTNA